jgi:hypothetical protein
MRLVAESFPVHARAGSAGHLSAAATATSDLDITVLTHDSGRHPAHQTGATAGRRPDRRAAGSAAPGAVLDRLRLRGGRFYNLGPRRHRDRLRGQHLDAPRLIRQRGALLLLVSSPREEAGPHRELSGLRLG